MRYFSRFAVAAMLLVLWTAGCVSVESEIEFTPDITLEELQEKMAAARDSQGIFRDAVSYVQQQVITVGRAQYLMEIKYKEPNRFKITTILDNKPLNSIILNDQAGWSVDYRKERSTQLAGGQLAQLRTFYRLSNPHERYRELFTQVSLSGAKIGDEEFYKIVCHLNLENHPELIVYIGKNSYLLRRIKIPAQDYTSIIDRYTLFNGVMVPVETKIFSRGISQTARIIENHLNVEIDDTEFLPPIFGGSTSGH